MKHGQAIFLESAVLVTAFLACLPGGEISAAPIVFSIDSSQSSLTVSGDVDLVLGGFPFGNYAFLEQGPGSLTAPLSGNVKVDTDLSNSLEFTGASAIVPGFSGTWSPGAGGAAGSQSAQYGVLVEITPADGIEYAVTGAVFDATSPVLALTAGSFDSTQLIFTLLSATVDFRAFGVIGGSGSSNYSNIFAGSQAAGGTLALAGNLATLSVPIDAGVYDLAVGSSTAHVHVNGHIVATAIVPEPSSFLFATLALMAVTPWGHLAARRRGRPHAATKARTTGPRECLA